MRIGGGDFGGEPEDNIRCRDWKWVEATIEALAVKLGAKVERVSIEAKEDP